MFHSITLEVSLKPFRKTDESYVRAVCAQIFEQWRPLLKGRDEISLMLWVGDGSELLDYTGNLDETFEWARFIGTANLPYLPADKPRQASLHHYKQNYCKDAPVMTYAILKRIIACLKEEGKRAFPEATVLVGETFDIGPEFAISSFKYERHTEISSGTRLDHFGFVDATATLNADDRAYAAYPNGIPEGTPFGTFLGAQANIFLRDMGFDYLWLSNGLGFSADPWDKTGKIFDGKQYYPEKLDATRDKVFSFWKLFRDACPDIPLRTRGTNNSVGIDYASDGVPLYDIYRAGLDITAPPNSPWAALNDNFGLEMMGHMSRICELPSDKIPFRYYIHDPWWVNSPWYDRYDGSPCDIYLPMAISRIDATGEVQSANTLNILSIDNSYGTMPDACVNEPLPHLLKAEKDAPDAPAPLVWIYPMREYTTTDDASLLREMNLGDNYVCAAINDGLPLCCVSSTDSFLAHDLSLYRASTVISPVPERVEVENKLHALTEQGIGVIVYGTGERLATLASTAGFTLLDVEQPVTLFREALKTFGYSIEFDRVGGKEKPPTMALSRSDNALFLAVYNVNTTTDARLRLPLGAPILCGGETVLRDGHSTYRFGRGEHRECRVLVDQREGVLSCREIPPVNARFRRVVRVQGLVDATVTLFGEKGCECAVFDTGWNCLGSAPIHDERHGDYLRVEHYSGTLYLAMGHKGENPFHVPGKE